MGRPRLISEGAIEGALRSQLGIKALAAKALKTTRQNINQRVIASPHLQAVMRDIDQTVIDIAKSNVSKALQKGDNATSRWLLERRDPAYSNKVDTRIDDAQLEAFVESLGGDVEKLRAALIAAGSPPD